MTLSANLALSLDGKISSERHDPAGWGSDRDHARLLELRRGIDAILVGRGTLEVDQMRMIVPDQEFQPLRCIVSRRGVIDPGHPLWSAPNGGRVHVLATAPEPGAIAALESSGAVVHRGSLAGFLNSLVNHHGVRSIHCEGGGELIQALLELDAIDVLHLTWVGTRIFGGEISPTVAGTPGEFFPVSKHFRLATADLDNASGEARLTYHREREVSRATQSERP